MSAISGIRPLGGINTGTLKIIRFGRKNSSAEVIREGLPDLYPRLWRFCFGLTGATDVAEDLAQATVARALERSHLFTPGTHLDRWIFVMARRMWINERRKDVLRTGQGLVAADEAHLPDPSAVTETNILARQVFNEITNLPESLRETVLLVYVEGYAYREAAEVLEIPIGTVMSRLAAARKKLGQRLGHEKTGT